MAYKLKEFFEQFNTTEEIAEACREKHVLTSTHNGLSIIRYSRNELNTSESPQFDINDYIVMACRGVIIENETNRVLCYPPEKSVSLAQVFGNDDDSTPIVLNTYGPIVAGDNIDKQSAVPIIGVRPHNSTPELPNQYVYAESYIDGTMVNMFYHQDEWKISTRSNIGANNNYYSKRSFRELFYQALNFKESDYDNLHKEFTYSWVLCHPENQIVVAYPKPFVVLVSVRQVTESGYQELSLMDNFIELAQNDTMVHIPRTYAITTLGEARKFLKQTKMEVGLVFKHSNGLRTKIMNEDYLKGKELRGNTPNMKYLYLEKRQQKGFLKNYLKYFPIYARDFRIYQNEIHTMTSSLHTYYLQVNVKKELKFHQIPFQFRQLVRELHSYHYKTGKKIYHNVAIEFVNSLPPARQLYVLNYERNQATLQAKLQNVREECFATLSADVGNDDGDNTGDANTTIETEKLQQVVSKVHQMYMQFKVKREITREQIPEMYVPLMDSLHQYYMKSRQSIYPAVVLSMMKSLTYSKQLEYCNDLGSVSPTNDDDAIVNVD